MYKCNEKDSTIVRESYSELMRVEDQYEYLR